MKLGFFESGLGGLLMMESCIKKYPNHDYVYMGDTANLPYGPRASIDIESFMSPYIVWLFEEKSCDLVFIACNTASVKALPLFKEKYPQYSDRVIDIVEPTCMYLRNNIDDASSLLVLATQGTVQSNLYQYGQSNIHQVPMPGLVELIEAGKKDAALVAVQDAISYYLNVQNILLGCTHYYWLLGDLQKKYPHINIIAQDTVLHNIISLLEISHSPLKPEYFVSDQPNIYTKKYNKNVLEIKLKNN